MLGRFILILVLVPIIEAVLLFQLLERAGLPKTLLLIFGTGIIGISIAKRQGMQAWSAVHAQMRGAQNPSQEIMNGVMILFAGAFLMTPGIITDVVGFLLLIPALRISIGKFAVKWFKTRTIQTFQASAATASGMQEQFSDAMDPHTNSGQFQDDDQEGPTVRVIDPNRDSP
ncbi:MAG: FxsA family protein [Fuerstiella sp.]